MNDEDMNCHDCGKLADHTMGFGWIFHCVPCNVSWGHPQETDRQEARERLYDAKAKE
jgi:hypothetical protein